MPPFEVGLGDDDTVGRDGGLDVSDIVDDDEERRKGGSVASELVLLRSVPKLTVTNAV